MNTIVDISKYAFYQLAILQVYSRKMYGINYVMNKKYILCHNYYDSCDFKDCD